MMKREELTDALRTEAEWAADHDYDIPLMLCENLQDAAAMLKADAAEIAALKDENERIRQNSVSQEVYQMMCEELDAAVKDMGAMALSMRASDELTENCCWACKYYNENNDNMEPWDECPGYETNNCFQWRGPQKGKE